MPFGPTGSMSSPSFREAQAAANREASATAAQALSGNLLRDETTRAMSGDGVVWAGDDGPRTGPNLLDPREFLLTEARNLRTWAANSDSHAKEYPGAADDMKRQAITLRGAAANFEAAAALIPVVE